MDRPAYVMCRKYWNPQNIFPIANQPLLEALLVRILFESTVEPIQDAWVKRDDVCLCSNIILVAFDRSEVASEGEVGCVDLGTAGAVDKNPAVADHGARLEVLITEELLCWEKLPKAWWYQGHGLCLGAVESLELTPCVVVRCHGDHLVRVEKLAHLRSVLHGETEKLESVFYHHSRLKSHYPFLSKMYIL